MADGKTKSAAQFYMRVAVEECLFTDNFSTNEKCIGCGHCAKICPAYAIHMNEKRPEWVKPECFMCFGCLRLCPTGAIRYGDTDQEAAKKSLPTSA